MYYYFDKSINNETVNDLVSKLEDREDINLWFSTSGGQVDSMVFLVNFFNSIKDKLTITFASRVSSIGLILLTDFEGKLEISQDYDFSIFHKIDCQLDSQRKCDVNSKVIISYLEKDNIKLLQKFTDKGILNSEQAKRFEEGEDVVLYRDDIMKLSMFAKKNQP